MSNRILFMAVTLSGKVNEGLSRDRAQAVGCYSFHSSRRYPGSIKIKGIDVPPRPTAERVATSEPARISVRIFVVMKEPDHYSSSCGKGIVVFSFLSLCRGRRRKNEKINVIVKAPYQNASEKLLYTDGSQIRNYFIKEFDSLLIMSDLCILSRKHSRAFGYPFNVNICGVDFYGTIIFAGPDGDKLTDVPFDLNKLKILFPDLFLEE